MINHRISDLQKELTDLKSKYKNLIEDIKKSFYDKENYFDENSKRKPGGERAEMLAALCLAQEKCPRHSFELNPRKAEIWRRDEENITLDYWILNQKEFQIHGDIPCTIIIKKKNLKLLTDICEKVWVKEVCCEYRPKTKLGFKDWLSKIHVDDLFELMMEHYNDKDSNIIHLVTDKNLYIKDIVVIFPPNYRW